VLVAIAANMFVSGGAGMSSYGEIRERAGDLHHKLVEIRRHFHSYPELSFQEKETGNYIYDLMNSLGLETKKEVGGTGVTALLQGLQEGPTVALRADMDALPIQDTKEVSYASTREGVCHACGHDVHMAVLIGTALILSEKREELKGQVKFIFQPAEEKPPGGARLMVQEGVLDNPRVNCILGIHTFPYHRAGKVVLKKGELMAAADSFKLTIRGKGGHGAAPHQSVDAVVVASQVVQALQLISSRMVDPLEPLVVTIGTINGGESFNIIAEEVEMKGTVRTLNPHTREKIPEIIENIAEGITKGFKATYLLEYDQNYPVLMNDPRVMEVVEGAAREILGQERVVNLEKPVMGSEDFSCYLEQVPGAFVFLGTGGEGEVYPWHHHKFDVDEGVLSTGAAFLSWSAVKLLQNPI